MKTSRSVLVALSLAATSLTLPALCAENDFKPGPAPAWTLTVRPRPTMVRMARQVSMAPSKPK